MASAWAPAASAKPTAVPVSPLRTARASAFAANDAATAAPPPAAASTGSKWARAAPLVAPCHVTPPDEPAAPLFAAMLPRHNGAPLRGWTQPASVLYSQPVAVHGGAAANALVLGDDDDDDDDAFRDDRHDDWAGGAASDADGEFQAQQQKSPHSPPRAGVGAGGRFARKRAADAAHAESPAAAESSPEATSPWPRAAAAAAPLQLEQATNAARAIGVYKRLRQGFTPRSPAAQLAPAPEPPPDPGAAAAGAAAAPRRGVKKPAPTYQRSLAAFLTRR